MKSGVTIVGAGRIGTSLAVALAEGSMFDRVVLLGRSPAPPRLIRSVESLSYGRLSHISDAGAAHGTGVEPADPECLVFSVPDDALDEIAASWRDTLSRGAGSGPRVALHTSGVRPAEALAPLRAGGARLGSWHPLLALSEPRRRAFEGVTVGVEGEEEAIALGERIAGSVGARTIRIATGRKALYHAAAVFGSNYLVACLGVARRLLAESGAGHGGLEDLLPLARSALESVAASGLETGATGPISRGDVGTVRGHLEGLDPATRALYRALALELLTVTGDRPGAERREALARLLAGRDRDLDESFDGLE